MTLDLSRVLSEPIDARFKGFPHAAATMSLGDIGRQGWNVLRGDLPFPVAVVKRSAMRQNSAWMREFTRATGVRIAPHGKTTMCPQIFARQIEDGAWGITVANVRQLDICVAIGVRRLIVANQILARGDVARLIDLSDRDPALGQFSRQIKLHSLMSVENRPCRLCNGQSGGNHYCQTNTELLNRRVSQRSCEQQPYKYREQK